MMSSQLDVVLGPGRALRSLPAVAAAARRVIKAVPFHPIPDDKRLDLERQYGRWAVETAVAVCPHNDIRCIEREAKRFHQARTLRR